MATGNDIALCTRRKLSCSGCSYHSPYNTSPPAAFLLTDCIFFTSERAVLFDFELFSTVAWNCLYAATKCFFSYYRSQLYGCRNFLVQVLFSFYILRHDQFRRCKYTRPYYETITCSCSILQLQSTRQRFTSVQTELCLFKFRVRVHMQTRSNERQPQNVSHRLVSYASLSGDPAINLLCFPNQIV